MSAAYNIGSAKGLVSESINSLDHKSARWAGRTVGGFIQDGSGRHNFTSCRLGLGGRVAAGADGVDGERA
jgi:hypothetical protein